MSLGPYRIAIREHCVTFKGEPVRGYEINIAANDYLPTFFSNVSQGPFREAPLWTPMQALLALQEKVNEAVDYAKQMEDLNQPLKIKDS
jgi:hypothetical protein